MTNSLPVTALPVAPLSTVDTVNSVGLGGSMGQAVPAQQALYSAVLGPSMINTTGLSITGSLGLGSVDFAARAQPGKLKAGVIDIQGPEADICINGVSLMTVLQGIQERLNILEPNRTLEAEWDQLRELGNQYRALEAELQQKQRMWSQLNARNLHSGQES